VGQGPDGVVQPTSPKLSTDVRRVGPSGAEGCCAVIHVGLNLAMGRKSRSRSLGRRQACSAPAKAGDFASQALSGEAQGFLMIQGIGQITEVGHHR